MELGTMAQAKKAIKSEKPSFIDTYAIFQTGGKQYQAVPGQTIAVEKLEGQEGDIIEFSEVLLRKDDGKIDIGQPFVSTSIKASIIKHLKAPKVIVFKFKRRKKSRVKKGHRQLMTVIRVQSI